MVWSIFEGARTDAGPTWVEHEVDDSRFLRGRLADVVAVLEAGCRTDFIDAADDLLAEVDGLTDWVMLLVPRKEPPLFGRRQDGRVLSFTAAGSVVRRLMTQLPDSALADLSYLLLHAILNQRLDVSRLCVRQIGHPHVRPAVHPMTTRVAVIMAHRGDPAYLRTALALVDRATSASMLTARVGLDVDDVAAYAPIAEEFSRHEIFAVDRPPAGPYVIRQGLVEGATEDLLVFQDSDDVSCSDRFDVQQAELASGDVDLVGCQEIEVDEIERRVDAVRYPRDVSAALARDDSAASCYHQEEPLLHATAMMRRGAFMYTGGLSTDRRIANDTQFMLRAYFSMRMKNSDEFLYIRRRHPHALTVAHQTAAGCDLRRALGTAWSVDFEAIKQGRLRLAESALRTRRCANVHRLSRLAVVERPLPSQP